MGSLLGSMYSNYVLLRLSQHPVLSIPKLQAMQFANFYAFRFSGL